MGVSGGEGGGIKGEREGKGGVHGGGGEGVLDECLEGVSRCKSDLDNSKNPSASSIVSKTLCIRLHKGFDSLSKVEIHI